MGLCKRLLLVRSDQQTAYQVPTHLGSTVYTWVPRYLT